jgi:hypothetical protein
VGPVKLIRCNIFQFAVISIQNFINRVAEFIEAILNPDRTPPIINYVNSGKSLKLKDLFFYNFRF